MIYDMNKHLKLHLAIYFYLISLHMVDPEPFGACFANAHTGRLFKVQSGLMELQELRK